MTNDHPERGVGLSAIIDAELEKLLRVKAALNEGKELIKAGNWCIVDCAKRENQISDEGREAIAAAQRARHRTRKREQREKKENPLPPPLPLR